MDSKLIQVGQFLRRTEAGNQHNRENWIGVITHIHQGFGMATILWLYLSHNKHDQISSINTEVYKASDLNNTGAGQYTYSFITSKRIEAYPLIMGISNLPNLKRFSEATRERIRAHLGQPLLQQQELPLETEQQEPPKQPESAEDPKLFMVIETAALKPMTRHEADKLLRQAALQQPGKTFTLVQMLQHAKYPIEPLIVKA